MSSLREKFDDYCNDANNKGCENCQYDDGNDSDVVGCAMNFAYQKGREDVLDHIEKYMLTNICASCNQEACEGGMVASIQECETIRFLKGAIHDAIVELKETKA